MRTKLFVLISAVVTVTACVPAIAKARSPLKVWPNASSQSNNTAPARPNTGTPPKQPSGPVADPSNFHGSGSMAASSSTIELSWIDNAKDEDQYHLCRKQNHAANYDPSKNIVLPANSTKYHDTGLEPETLYTYGLAASRGNQYSFMVETDVTTNPRPPTDLKAKALSSKQVQLTWTNTSKTAELIMIERSTGNSSSFQKIFQTQPINLSSYVDSGVAANTQYYYRLVVLKLPFNASDYTPGVPVLTPAN